ncbi:MAG: hypothetical protein U5R31_15950 [Acidimicrobiia bacterium]|nr:hypothetical protein [Acidimicrobiia bacterium]
MVRATRDHGFRSQSTAAARAAALAWRRLVASRRAEVDDVDHQHAADLAFRHLVTRLDHELLYGPVVPAARSSDQELTEELTEVLLDVLAAGRVEVR